MGSIGAAKSSSRNVPREETLQDVINNIEQSYTNPVEVRSYDIEERAEEKGYDSAADMVQEDLTADNSFWTRDDEMVQDVEDLGYSVTSSPNGEYFTVMDENDESDTEFIVYYEVAGSSRYITRVRKA